MGSVVARELMGSQQSWKST